MFDEVDIEAWLVKHAIMLVVLLVLIACVIFWLWHEHEQAMVNAAAPAKAAAAMDSGQIQSGQQAIKITVDNGKASAATDAQTRLNTDAINKLAAAKVAVDPAVDDAIRRGVCVYVSAASLPECQSLLHPGP